MTKREKRLQKIRQNPKNVSKEILDSVLTDFGFEARKGKGSHTIYTHPNEENAIAVASHKSHVPVYIVKQVLEAIDRIKETDKDEDDGEND